MAVAAENTPAHGGQAAMGIRFSLGQDLQSKPGLVYTGNIWMERDGLNRERGNRGLAETREHGGFGPPDPVGAFPENRQREPYSFDTFGSVTRPMFSIEPTGMESIMNLLRMERNDKRLARALGIRAKQEALGADHVLDSEEMRDLCRGRDNRGMKMLVGAFVDGWKVQSAIEGR